MSVVDVESLRFSFHSNIAAEKYDDWAYYALVLRLEKHQKAVDVVAMRMQPVPADVWLIEAKDFRVITVPPDRANLAGLAVTAAAKFKDSLDGLAEAARLAPALSERHHAQRAVAATTRRLVLHLEPHIGSHSKLFPKNFPAGVLQKLKQLVRDLDPAPMVLSIASTGRARVPWTVE